MVRRIEDFSLTKKLKHVTCLTQGKKIFWEGYRAALILKTGLFRNIDTMRQSFSLVFIFVHLENVSTCSMSK